MGDEAARSHYTAVVRLSPDMRLELETRKWVASPSRPGRLTRTATTADGTLLKQYVYACVDCHVKWPDIPIVKRDVLEQAGVTGDICYRCLEKRLGRRLDTGDLRLAKANAFLFHMLGLELEDMAVAADVHNQ